MTFLSAKDHRHKSGPTTFHGEAASKGSRKLLAKGFRRLHSEKIRAFRGKGKEPKT